MAPEGRAKPRGERIRRRLNDTGIGLAGIDGVWWMPAAQPFALPDQLSGELAKIGQALFLLLDTVMALYGTPAGTAAGLDALLEWQVPANVPRLRVGGRVEGLRPDFQLLPGLSGGTPFRLMATELEICPSAHGFAHAMQVAYELAPDLVESYARYLNGREFLFIGSNQWSEFIFEQLAFCRALAEAGARCRVLYDLPVEAIAEEVRQGRRWQLPMFGIEERPECWNGDVLGRLQDHGLAPFLVSWGDDWPQTVGNAVLFRFGYVDLFSPARLQHLRDWQAQGATLFNPPLFALDSKSLMATLGVPSVRAHIAAADADALAVLDRAIPETHLLDEVTAKRLLDEKDGWVLKYAGFDGNNQAWGGRSLQIGRELSADGWHKLLRQALDLPWPIVAQRHTPSRRVDIAYLDETGDERQLNGGTTRLRAFLLRDETTPAGTVPCGSHVTVASSTRVAESTKAVQAPVEFRPSTIDHWQLAIDDWRSTIPKEPRL